MNKFFVRTFGCQMNKDDSERIAGIMEAAGFRPSDGLDDADIVIYNTCCVRQNADDRLYGQVSALKGLKVDRPDVIIAVGGCLPQMDGAKIREKLAHVDIVFGTHNVGRLPVLIESAATNGPIFEILEDSDVFTGDLPAVRRHKWHSWLPITVGCDNFCTYCIVPYVRGREKSRPLERLLHQCDQLVDEGVREITLLGQNVNSYGRDLYGEPRFAELLAKVAGVAGIERVRFTTSHPKDLTDEVIELVAAEEKLCPHIHLPLQAGSDRILERMGRKYSAERYLRIVAKIRERISDASITTDIMVGFPGETEEDFRLTLGVVRASRFDQAFTFIYSPRPGTRAAAYDDQVPEEEKSRRFKQLIALQNDISLENNRGLLGRKMTAFVEGLSKKDRHRLAARTLSNKLVHLNGPDALIGRTLDVEIKYAFSWFLLGEAANV